MTAGPLRWEMPLSSWLEACTGLSLSKELSACSLGVGGASASCACDASRFSTGIALEFWEGLDSSALGLFGMGVFGLNSFGSRERAMLASTP